MIKKAFWLLLLANLTLFAYLQWGNSLTQGPANFQPPLHPEQIKLLGYSPAAQSSAVLAASAASSSVALLAAQSQPASAVPASTASAPTVCLEWGEFSGADLARANDDLTELKLGPKLTQREVEHSIGYWVYIPPLKTHSDAIKKISQLKDLGITEFFIVQDKGKWQNAISLGVFKSEEVAKKFLDHLKSKGVRSAVMGERQTRLKFTVFILRNPEPTTLNKLTEWQKDFTGIEMKSVTCN